MKNKGIAKILSFILLFLLSGCGNNNEEIASEVSESEIDVAVKLEPEELLDAFLAGEIPAAYDSFIRITIMQSGLYIAILLTWEEKCIG